MLWLWYTVHCTFLSTNSSTKWLLCFSASGMSLLADSVWDFNALDEKLVFVAKYSSLLFFWRSLFQSAFCVIILYKVHRKTKHICPQENLLFASLSPSQCNTPCFLFCHYVNNQINLLFLKTNQDTYLFLSLNLHCLQNGFLFMIVFWCGGKEIGYRIVSFILLMRKML